MSGHDHTDQAPERQIRRGSTHIKKEEREIMRFSYASRLHQPPHLALFPVSPVSRSEVKINSYNVSTYAIDEPRGLAQGYITKPNLLKDRCTNRVIIGSNNDE
jgi:hypothetical protein